MALNGHGVGPGPPAFPEQDRAPVTSALLPDTSGDMKRDTQGLTRLPEGSLPGALGGPLSGMAQKM